MKMILEALGEKEKGVAPKVLPPNKLSAPKAFSLGFPEPNMLGVVCEVLDENGD
jgi:hypothetical protein